MSVKEGSGRNNADLILGMIRLVFLHGAIGMNYPLSGWKY
jgi:hypothetical protein